MKITIKGNQVFYQIGNTLIVEPLPESVKAAIQKGS
mgnify:CR=1 FL=1